MYEKGYFHTIGYDVRTAKHWLPRCCTMKTPDQNMFFRRMISYVPSRFRASVGLT